MRRSNSDSKERQGRRRTHSKIEMGHRKQPDNQTTRSVVQPSPGGQPLAAVTSRSPPRLSAAQSGTATTSVNFKYLVNKPQAIVIDLLGVVVCKSFMTSSKEFRDFFHHNVLEYLSDNWKQKQLKIMINFFRCSQATVPDEFKLADRDEPREEQIKQAKKHVIWKLRNDPTNSALSLFMLGITEWGYRNKTLQTSIYEEIPHVLKQWREFKVPVYVGVGSADFLIMVLTNTKSGDILQYFNGHMNIMDFDGTKANKDFKKLASILRVSPEKILYLTRFRQDYKRAIESGLQAIMVLRPDFDSHGLVQQLKARRANAASADATKASRMVLDEGASPPAATGRGGQDIKDQAMRLQYENNISSLSLIDDHEDTGPSSQLGEQDLMKFNIILNLSELAFK